MKQDDYFLLNSGNRWIKNTYRALKAIDSIYNDFPDLKIKTLVTGIENIPKFINFVKNKNRFIFTDFVEEDELEVLYKNAYIFVFPSLNEGFGYPPIESMKYGTPVICSAISSITEVCGNAAMYFNPFDINDNES